jgi:hypothetical protein
MLDSRMRKASFANHIVKDLQRSDMNRLRHALVISYVNSVNSFIKECNSKDNVGRGVRQATEGWILPSEVGGVSKHGMIRSPIGMTAKNRRDPKPL